MKFIKKKLSAGLAALLLAFLLLPMQAYAIEPIVLDRDVELTVCYVRGNKALEGARFDLYRVGDTTAFAVFTVAGDFKDYPGSINGLETAEKWDALAQELLTYAEKNSIAPLTSGRTDAEGKCVFADQKPGLYLLAGQPMKVGRTTYSCNPAVICLPGREADAEEWSYQVSAYPKPDDHTAPTPPDEPPHLPQTGLLWWPVPVLLCAGLVLTGIGAARRRRTEHEK